MTQFVYDKKFEKNKYKHSNEKLNNLLRGYVTENFKNMDNRMLAFEMLPMARFENGVAAKVLCNEKIIQLPFEKWNKFLKYKQCVDSNERYLFNSLHHELTHLNDEYRLKSFYEKVNSIEKNKFLVGGINLFISEFSATYYAQLAHCSYQGAINEVINLIPKLGDCIDNQNCITQLEKFDYFIEETAYSLGEIASMKYSSEELCSAFKSVGILSFEELVECLRDPGIETLNSNYERIKAFVGCILERVVGKETFEIMNVLTK